MSKFGFAKAPYLAFDAEPEIVYKNGAAGKGWYIEAQGQQSKRFDSEADAKAWLARRK